MKRAIVVGSGAGGAAVARTLAGSMDVTIVEAGSDFHRFDGDLARLERFRSSRLLVDPRMISLLFPEMRVAKTCEGMALVRGVATGGTTTMATGNALRCDRDLVSLGIDLSEELRSLEQELPLSTGHRRRWRPVTRDLFSTCETLGLQPVITRKMVDYARCSRCGRCVFGCPMGAKWDSRRMLDQAVRRGARLLTNSQAERVVLQDAGSPSARATGVLLGGARRRFLAADLVVLAAGGLGTGAILSRSAISTEDALFVDPVLCVAARADGCFADEEVPMPFYVEGDGCIISPYFDHLSFFFDRAWRPARHDIVSLMIKLADSGSGTVGRRKVSKRLTERDRIRLRTATDTCARILGAYGIERSAIFLGTLNAGHPGGTLPLTGRERLPLHPDHLPENLYVADASLLPQSLGKPPMLTIMALAQRIGALCAARFG